MKPPIFKIITINLLKDLSQWEARRTLLDQELVALKPDSIALQEVAMRQNNTNVHLRKSISKVLGLPACAGSA